MRSRMPGDGPRLRHPPLPARRSTACAPRTRSTSGPSDAAAAPGRPARATAARRGAARRCSPTASTPSCSTRAPRLRAIANYAVGTDNIDLEAAARARHRGRQHARRAHRRDRRPRLRAAARAPRAGCPRRGRRCATATGGRGSRRRSRRTTSPARRSGIVGGGRIGQAVARRAAGFDMEVLHSARSSGVPLRRAARARRLRLAARAAHARDPPPDRRGGARAR